MTVEVKNANNDEHICSFDDVERIEQMVAGSI